MKKAVQYSDKFGQVLPEGEEPKVRPTPGVKVEAKVEKTEAKAAAKVEKTEAKAAAKVEKTQAKAAAKADKKLPEGGDE